MCGYTILYLLLILLSSVIFISISVLIIFPIMPMLELSSPPVAIDFNSLNRINLYQTDS